MKLSLVILAAGMGSRFGGLKQITPVSKSGESIIDFSIYDALRSGYTDIVIITRKEIQKDFHDFFGKRLEKQISIQYAFQEIDESIIPDRRKPFGTAHAVLAAKDLVEGPFSVINADDFYGLDSFQQGAEFLKKSNKPGTHAVIGFSLGKTLSEHGTVSRAQCKVDNDNNLTHIRELLKVSREGDAVCYNLDDVKHPIKADTPVSMNFWCFQPTIIPHFESNWQDFKETLSLNPEAEYLIPDVANNMIKNNSGTFKVLPTESDWFGITYKEDFEGLVAGISNLVDSGFYPNSLWT